MVERDSCWYRLSKVSECQKLLHRDLELILCKVRQLVWSASNLHLENMFLTGVFRTSNIYNSNVLLWYLGLMEMVDWIVEGMSSWIIRMASENRQNGLLPPDKRLVSSIPFQGESAYALWISIMNDVIQLSISYNGKDIPTELVSRDCWHLDIVPNLRTGNNIHWQWTIANVYLFIVIARVWG